jgi:hypothetical protein
MTEQDLADFDRESERRQRAADFDAAHPEYREARCFGCFIRLQPDQSERRDGVLLCIQCSQPTTEST